MAKSKTVQSGTAASKAMAGSTISIVKKSAVKFRKKKRVKLLTGDVTWAVWPCVAHGKKSDCVTWVIRDGKEHDLVIYLPSDVFDPATLKSDDNTASSCVVPGAKPGYYEYEVYVDGEFARGCSAPGIIIE